MKTPFFRSFLFSKRFHNKIVVITLWAYFNTLSLLEAIPLLLECSIGLMFQSQFYIDIETLWDCGGKWPKQYQSRPDHTIDIVDLDNLWAQ